jgi:hypothetical protein
MNFTVIPARRHAGARAQERRAVRRYTDQAKHDATNLEAATIIASDQVTYPADSLAGLWARRVLKKQAGEIPQMAAA